MTTRMEADMQDGSSGRFEDVTPTPEAYRNMLSFIAANSTRPAHRKWAEYELERVKDVTEWGVQNHPLMQEKTMADFEDQSCG